MLVALHGLGSVTYAFEIISFPGESNRTRTLNYDYDMLSQLTSASITNIGGSPWYGDYYYDKDGNIYRKTIDSNDTWYEYDTDNTNSSVFDSDIMTWADGNLIWDANGRLVGTPAVAFEYNPDGKLRTATINEGNSISLKYDLMGNRVYKSSTAFGQTTARKYIVDVSGKLPTILCEIDPNTGSLKNSYFYTPSGQILCQQVHDIGAEPNEPNERYFYIHDRLGSVRLVINDAADVNNSYTYDPFGNLFTAETAETTENPFRFTGQWYDSEIGQYYLRARQYDPQLMRFTSRDPVKGKFKEPLTLHVYLYCGNEPIGRVDLTGAEYSDGPWWAQGDLYSELWNEVVKGAAATADGFWFIPGHNYFEDVYADHDSSIDPRYRFSRLAGSTSRTLFAMSLNLWAVNNILAAAPGAGHGATMAARMLAGRFLMPTLLESMGTGGIIVSTSWSLLNAMSFTDNILDVIGMLDNK